MKYLREYSDPEVFDDFDIEDDKVYNILRHNRDEIEIPLKKMDCRYGLGDMVELHRSYFAYKNDVFKAIENMNDSLDFFKKLEMILEDVNDTIETKFNPVKIRCNKPIGKLCRVFYKGDTEDYISMEEGHFTISVAQSLDDQNSTTNGIVILNEILSHLNSMNVKKHIKVICENTRLRGSLRLDMFKENPTYVLTHTFNIYYK